MFAIWLKLKYNKTRSVRGTKHFRILYPLHHIMTKLFDIWHEVVKSHLLKTPDNLQGFNSKLHRTMAFINHTRLVNIIATICFILVFDTGNSTVLLLYTCEVCIFTKICLEIWEVFLTYVLSLQLLVRQENFDFSIKFSANHTESVLCWTIVTKLA